MSTCIQVTLLFPLVQSCSKKKQTNKQTKNNNNNKLVSMGGKRVFYFWMHFLLRVWMAMHISTKLGKQFKTRYNVHGW